MNDDVYDVLSEAVAVAAYSLSCNPSRKDRERDLYVLQSIINDNLGNNMKKFYVSYNTTYGDDVTVWVMASDKEEAAEIVEDEYWDVAEITSVREA